MWTCSELKYIEVDT